MADVSDYRRRCRGSGDSVNAAEVSDVMPCPGAMRRHCRVKLRFFADVAKSRSSVDSRFASLMTSARLLLATTLLLSLSSSLNVLAEGFEYKGSENNGCSAVKQAIGGNVEMSVKMIPVQQLHVCSQAGGSTCCTPQTEADLIERSKEDFNKIIWNRTNTNRQMFAGRFNRLNGFITELVNRSRAGLHDMFVKTYGLLYQQNAQIFTDLFADFQAYIDGRRIDLTDVLDQFFVELMRRMFALVNDVQPSELGDSYVSCMTTRIDRLRPFGDVPGKLATQLKRAFVAARALMRGLAVGRDIVSALGKMEPSVACVHALTRMSYCPYCRGLTDVRPCQTYCLNVARGCLATRADVNDVWNSYIDEMLKLSVRLKGPFNIVNVVSPIDVKLSDAIMNFQENSETVSSKIFQGCGLVPSSARSRRHLATRVNESVAMVAVNSPSTRRVQGGSRRSSFSIGVEPSSSSYSRPTTTRSRPPRSDTDLEHLVDELMQRLLLAKDLWKRQLTQAVCGSISDIPIGAGSTISPNTVSSVAVTSRVQPDEVCWNGHSRSRYTHNLVGEGTRSQTSNPEVEQQSTKSPAVSKAVLQLKETIAELRRAFNGQELSRDDNEGALDGSGSGDSMEEFSGSGLGCDDDLCISSYVSVTPTRRSMIEVITDTGTTRMNARSVSSKNLCSVCGLLWCLLVTLTWTIVKL